MPSLEKLNSDTFPVILVENEDDPFIAYCYRNKKTRSAREKLRESLKSIRQTFERIGKDVQGLRDEATKLDKTEQIAAKQDALTEATGEQKTTLETEIKALEAEQEKVQPKIDQIIEKITDKLTKAEEAAQEGVAQQLVHFVHSTNVKLTDAEDSPVAPATFEFWNDTFDYETLQDFLEKIATALDGPLAMRGRSTS